MALTAGQTGHLTDHQEGAYTVVHGSTAGTARPTLGSSGTAPTKVLWDGSVAPTNAVSGDFWWDTTNELFKRYDGSAWNAAGSATYLTAPTRASFPASRFSIVAGAPSLSSIQFGNWPAWLLDAATTEEVASTFLSGDANDIPEDWTTFDIVGRFAMLGSTAGNAVFRVITGAGPADGAAYPTGSTTTLSPVTFSTQRARKDVTLMSGVTRPTTGLEYQLRIARLGGDASDDLAGDLALVRVEFVKAS